MELEAFCRQSRVVVVLGKGGVGKTTLTAALALAGARAGLDVLVVALDDSGDLPALFGRAEPFGYDEVLLAGCPKEPEDDAGQPQEAAPGAPRTGPAGGRVRARVVTSRAALLEYLDDHGLRRVSRRLVDSGALDVVSTAIPGIEEVLVLGKVKQLERERRADLILLDAPATGHAVTFLSSSEGLVDAARGGPLRQQAEQVVELLSDPTRCQALLVTLPEETPVNELVEAAYRLEDEVGVALGPVVVNGCYPELEGLETDPAVAARAAQEPEPDASYSGRLRRAAEFRLARQAAQAEQLERLSQALPLAQVRLPFLFVGSLGPAEVERLAEELSAGFAALPAAVEAGPGAGALKSGSRKRTDRETS